MQEVNKLLTLVIILLGWSVNGHAQSANPNQNANNFDKPETDLSKTKLEAADLFAYENRAIQKVEEFYQYLEVMANDELKDAVRDKAAQIVEKEFDSKARIISSASNRSLHEHLVQCRGNSNYKFVTELKWSQKLVLMPDSGYRGTIKVIYVNKDLEVPNKTSKQSAEEVTVILLRKKKKFGTVEKVVWELILGDIVLP